MNMNKPHGHYVVNVIFNGKEVPLAQFYSTANNAITNYILAQEALAKLHIFARMEDISISVR